MPAPADPIKRQFWLNKLRLAHKGRTPWNKGIEMPVEFGFKMGKIAKEFWANPLNKDKWQTKILENKGYKVFRFSETEINTSTDKCISSVKNYVKSLS